MKKTIDLLNEIVELGFDRDYALSGIDASIDDAIGFKNRKPLMEEFISEKLYEDILLGFKCEKEFE